MLNIFDLVFLLAVSCMKRQGYSFGFTVSSTQVLVHAYWMKDPTPPSRREGRPRRLEDWFPGRRRCPPGSSGPWSGVCECFYVGEGGGGGRRSSDLSSRLVSPRLYMFPALRRRKRSRSHPPSRPGL